MMNDNNLYSKTAVNKEWVDTPSQDEHFLTGQLFARRLRLPRIFGLGCLFFPLGGAMTTQPVAGGWWLFLLSWAFVWPHLAWQLANRSSDPHATEINNLKIDAILAGIWIGVMGMNIMPSAVLVMMISLMLMGMGGPRLFGIGIVLLLGASLVMLQLTGTAISLTSAPLEWWLCLPFILLYPPLFAWVSFRTFTRLARQKQRLRIMSTRDGMTGVYNRRHWEILLRNEFESCRRNQRMATLLLIDVDHFKTINDTYGHDVGDEAIIAISRHLQLTLRGSDIIGRFGGDEFAVIMSGTPVDSALAAMSRVHDTLAEIRLPDVPHLALQISVGLAPLTPGIEHYREWLKAADMALYKAKKGGRNRTEVAA